LSGARADDGERVSSFDRMKPPIAEALALANTTRAS
jgi:hypothetical protein